MASRRRAFPFELPVSLRRTACQWFDHVHPLPRRHLHRSFIPSKCTLFVWELARHRLLCMYGRVLPLWIVPPADLR